MCDLTMATQVIGSLFRPSRPDSIETMVFDDFNTILYDIVPAI